MSLLTEDWMPVRYRDGCRAWVAPSELADPRIVAFDADRADFNGALVQFAIALLQTSTPVVEPDDWDFWFEDPPDSATLTAWFSPLAAAFEYDGEGARFLQDFELRAGRGVSFEIAGLLIEAAGEQSVQRNTDHFVKHGQVAGMCPHCALTALLTLQINAPAGGSGHRTGLRGGGPLTTLVLCHPQRSLWHDLWLNVRSRSEFLASQGDPRKAAPHFRFPWLREIGAIQPDGGETSPLLVHPDHVFWAMPRRIRLDLTDTGLGDCDLCGRHCDRLIRRYETKNHGLNYKGPWNHPLSPYYETKEAWLPIHPQPGGIGYRHWLAWVMGVATPQKGRRPATVVSHFLGHLFPLAKGQRRLWAFGFDMDNMKARCWYEATLPLYGLADCQPQAQLQAQEEVARWLAGAELAASSLRAAVKEAWFGKEARGDLSAVEAGFWSRTEPEFYRHLESLITSLHNDVGGDSRVDRLPVRAAWQRNLINTCESLFDGEFVGTAAIERQNMQRVVKSWRRLRANLRGPAIRKALGLPDAEGPGTTNKAQDASAVPRAS